VNLSPPYHVYIQQAAEVGKTSLPYPSSPELDLRGSTHLGYALQWFFFTSLLLFGYAVFLKIQADRIVNQ
jgi:cytochrome oxidase assembly protein ShyY1